MMLKVLIFFSTLTQYITISLTEDIESLGCWKDSNKKRTLRSMEHKHHYLDDPYPKRSNAVKKCAQVAIDHGYSIFGVQNGGQCFSAPNGEKTYNMYGPSNLCRDGKGGKWSTDIYSTKTFHARSIHKSIDPSPWDAYCSRDLDIVILMDGSGSTSKKNKERWSEIKKFCAKFVKGFDDHARIGVIRYGADPDIVVDMQKGKKPEDIGDEIKPMDMPGGSRTLNDALKRAWREQLKENNRSAADKVVLAITTGDIPYGLYGSSQFLSDHDVRVIALGVDKNVHYEFLQSIASYRDVSNVFSVNSEQLSELAPFVYRDVCNTMPEYVSAPTPSPTKPPEETEKNITTASTNSTETKNTTATSSADNANITNTNTTNNSLTASNNTDTSVSNNNNNNNATQPKSRHIIPFAKDTINVLPSKVQRLPMREISSKTESVHVIGSKKAGLPKKAEVALKGRSTGTVFDNGMKKNVVTAVKKGAAKEEVATMVLVNPSPELNLFITDAEANAIHNRKPTAEGEYQYSSTSKDTVSKGNRTYYPLQKLPSYSKNITKPVLNRNPDIKPDENVFSDLESTSKNDNQVTKEFEQDQKSLETHSNTDDKLHEKSEDSKQDSSASSATVFTPVENNAISDKTAFDNAAPVIGFSKGKATKSIDSSNHNKDVSKSSQKLYKDLKTDQESDKMNSKLLQLKTMEREDLNKTSDMGNKTANAIENTETMSAEEVKSTPSDDGKPGEVYYDNAAAEKERNGNAPVVNAETFDGGENKKGSDSKIVGPGVVSQTVELHSGNGKKHVSDHPEMHVDYNNFFSGKLNDKLKSHEITHRKPMFNGRTIITPDKNGPLPESTTQQNLTTFQNSSAFIDDAGKELAEIYDKVHKINADLDDGKPSKAGPAVSPSQEKSVKTPNNASQYQFINAPTDTGPSVFEMDVDEHKENKSSFMPSEVAQTVPNTGNVNTNALPSKDHEAQFPQQNEQKLNENDKLGKEQKTPTDIVQPSSENSYHGEEKQQMQSTTVAALENKTAQIEKTESNVPNIESQESHQTSTVSNTAMVPNNENGENNANQIDSANNKAGQPQQNIAMPVAVSSEVQNFPVNTAPTNNSSTSSQLQGVEKSSQINKIPFNGNVMLQEDHKIDGNSVENSEETVGDHLTKKQDVHNTEQDTKDDKTPSDVETVGSLVGAVEQVSKDAAALAQQELDNMNDRRSYKTEDLVGGDYNEGLNAGAPNYDYAVSDDEQTRNALQERRQEINNLLKILDKEDQNNLLGKSNANNRNKIQSIDESAATRELKAVFDKINERIRFIHTNKRIGTNSRNNHFSHQDPLKYVNTITEYGDSGAIRSEPVTGKINIDGANIPFVSEEMSNNYYDNDAGDSSTKGVFNRRKPWSKAKNPSKKFENQNKEHISPYTTESSESDLTSEKVNNLNKRPSKKVPAIKHKTNRVPTSALILNKDDIQDVKTAAVSFQLPTNQKNQNNGIGPGIPATKQNKATSTNSTQKEFDKTGKTNGFKLPRIKTSALTIKVDDDDDQKGKGKINKMLQSYAQHVQKISTETKNQQKIDEHNKKIVNKISKLVDAIKPVDNAQAIPYKIPESNSMEANLSPEPYRPEKTLSQGEKAKNEKKLSKQKFQKQKKKPALYPGPSRPLINVSSSKISSLQNISFIPVPVDPHTQQSNIIYSQPTQYNDYQKKITNFQPKPVDQKNQQFAQTSSNSNESIVGQIVSFNPVLDGQKLNLHPVVNNAIITNTDSSFNKNLNSIGKPYISINHAHTKNLINNKGPTIGAYDNEDLVQQVNTLKTFVKGNNLQDHMLVNLNGINQKSSNQFLSRLPLPNHHSSFFEKTYPNIKPGHGIGVPFEPKLKEQYKIGNYVNNFHGSNIIRPINSTLGRKENRLKLVSSKYKHLNLNTLSRKDVAPKHTIKSHKVTQPEIPADVASMTSIGQGVKPRLNSHARPTLVPHHPPDFNSLFEHVRKTGGVSVHHKSKPHYVKGEKKTLQRHKKKTWKDSLGWARQEIAKERKIKKIKGSKKSGTWTEELFRPIKGNPLLRKHFVINHKRGNTKLASTLRKILLATNSNQTKKTPRKHKQKERKNFLQNEDKEFNMLERKIKNIEATISKTAIIRKKPKETVTASVRDELSSTVRREDGSSPRKDKKTFLDLLNRRGKPMTEQDVNTVQNYWSGRYASNPAPNTYTNAYSRNIPAKTTSAGGTSPFSQIAKELYRVRKLYNSRVKGNEGKGSLKHGMKHKTESLSAKKQSINGNKVKELDILNLEDKPESNWKDLITGELDKEMSEDDQIRLYNKKIDSSKQIEVGKNKYVFETTPAMSKQIINKGNKPTAKTEVITDADFPKKFSIADFKLSDLPTLPKGKSYVLSTPSLGYVMVRIRADSSFDDDNNKRKSPYFREIEELTPEDVSKHASDLSNSYATEKEIAQAVHKTDTEKEIAEAIHQKIPHEKTFFQAIKDSSESSSEPLEESIHSKSTEGRKPQAIVTYVGNPVSRHRAISSEVNEQSDEPQYHTASQHTIPDKQLQPNIKQNTVDVIKTEDTYEPIEVQLSKTATNPRIVTNSIFGGKVQSYSNSSTFLNSSIESNINDAESEGLINMVHSVIKENAKESKNFLQQKPKGSVIVGATLTPEKENDGELSNLINKIHSLNSQINDASANTSAPHVQDSNNKNLTVFMTNATTDSAESATVNKPQKINNISSDDEELPVVFNTSKTKTHAQNKTEDDNQIAFQNASISNEHIQNKTDKDIMATLKLKNNGSNTQEKVEEEKLASVFDKNESSDNHTESVTQPENYSFKDENSLPKFSPVANSTDKSLSNDNSLNNTSTKDISEVSEKPSVNGNLKNSTVQNLTSGNKNLKNSTVQNLTLLKPNEDEKEHFANTTLISMVKNGTYSNKVDNKTVEVTKTSELSEKNSTIDDADTNSMSSLEYTLGCNKPLRILYAIDVSDGLGAGPIRKKRWNRLKEFIGSINRDVIHNVRHHFMVYNIEPRFLKTFDTCDKDTEYFMTADECLCSKKDRISSSSGCSVNNPTMGESMEDWGTSGPRTGQALTRARKEFFAKDIHKYKNVIFLISHKDSMDSVEKAENDLKRDGISLVDIELGDRHDLKRRNIVQKVRHRHNNRRSDIENDSSSSSQDEHKMKVSLKKLQTTLRNIVGKVCKAQTDDDASKKSSIHQMSV